MLCYDDASEAAARASFELHTWATVVRIQTTVLLENVMYASWLEANASTWETLDYVGTISWRAKEKIKGDLNIAALIDKLNSSKQTKLGLPDVVPFALIAFEFTRTKCMLGETVTHHPNFIEAWVVLLAKMGVNAQAAVCRDVPYWTCNYWIARPAAMRAYIETSGTAATTF